MTRRALHALVVAPLFLMACGSDDKGATDPTAAASATTAVASTTLEGAWRTEPISPADAEATLSSAGLAEWFDEFQTRSPFAADTVLVLEIGGEWDLYGESADGTRTEIDYNASYELDGDQVVVIQSAGTNTFRWTIVGDTLTLEHLESSFPPFEGVPEEVFQKALYMTAEFKRAI